LGFFGPALGVEDLMRGVVVEQVAQGQVGHGGEGPVAGEQAEQRILAEVDVHGSSP
jgi:hypothetical protein